ncbi:thiamine pyrophosphate-requiring protein [Amycolatopsis sp. GM8]|uniref:thiamine pyrophosphate-requiring protein n=1 Tax=Amycolatopsis sp. GM8 TaxID=2896530 RepID=UPI001F024DB2|nr:thiamine pyrophosphate-requiring protein [Amycolatopsis sp. GM8]
MTEVSATTRTTAEAYLQALAARGVRRMFVNAGTDFAPIVEGYLRLREEGATIPEVVVCAHENLAVGMAHGAYLGDGGPQVVMLHTNVGTANAVCGALNAGHARIPILLVAGRSPVFEAGPTGARDSVIHWAQEMYDQAGMLREAVKWDYELRGSEQLHAVLDRAWELATAEPQGPVYLTLPREVLAQPIVSTSGPTTTSSPSPTHPDPEAIERLADLLAGAVFPVIVTSWTGADPATVAVLNEISDRYAIGVIEDHPRYVNAAADLPLHLGYAVDTALKHADVLCVTDVDVPWVPGKTCPADHTVVVQTGPAPLFGAIPMRSHRSDFSITAANLPLLTALRDALAARAPQIDPARRDRLSAVAEQRRTLLPGLASQATDGPIDKTFLNLALREVRPAGSVLVNEYWARPDLLPSEVGGYFGTPPVGGLGWGLPAALGLQMARPDDVVIAAVGDGAYLFANPAACHQVMRRYDLPVLTIVCSNGRWEGVRSATLSVYPAGLSATEDSGNPFAELAPLPDFEAYARASGGWGVRVSERSQLADALREAVRVVSVERRHALVNVLCA